MANLLDQKEEVLRVELTKYGRKKLATGHFEPAFYSFFDDCVIYDNSYTDFLTEDTNKIQDRILYESLSVSHTNLLDERINKRKNIEDNLSQPLGSSDNFNDYLPNWNLTALNGGINYTQESSSYEKKIFSFDDIKYVTEISDNTTNNNSIYELEDGRSIIIRDNYILLEIEEENVSNDKKNFEIELFAFDDISGGKEAGYPRKLNFIKKFNNIINDIIYDVAEMPQIFSNIELSLEDASFYFDVLVDEEIDREIIVKIEKDLQEKVTSTYATNFVDKITKDDC
jgi:hypothetical protein